MAAPIPVKSYCLLLFEKKISCYKTLQLILGVGNTIYWLMEPYQETRQLMTLQPTEEVKKDSSLTLCPCSVNDEIGKCQFQGFSPITRRKKSFMKLTLDVIKKRFVSQSIVEASFAQKHARFNCLVFIHFFRIELLSSQQQKFNFKKQNENGKCQIRWLTFYWSYFIFLFVGPVDLCPSKICILISNFLSLCHSPQSHFSFPHR